MMLPVVLVAFLGGAQSPWRLPQTVTPSHYRISLELDVEGGQFSGDETIEVSVGSSVREIVLNSLGLEISSARIRRSDESSDLDIVIDDAHERVLLRSSSVIPSGDAALDIAFSGPLKEGLRGLYLSRSGDDVFGATQMQGTYARMMFPSFDEPAFKATYALDVVVNEDSMAISNGPVIAEEVHESTGRKRVRFGKSPFMSTYLVALAVGPFDCIEETVDDIPVRVCGRPEMKAELTFAMEVARAALRFFNRWYGIPYPFGKLDMVALPDYEWGGMENTAAIYYRESSLLVDPATASPARRKGVASLVSHEIAHQWFGDLVTTAWWDDIWLNEGFATWMTPKAVAAFDPEFTREEESAAAALYVMGLDSLASTRPIHGEAETPDEIKEMFDGIAYTKGAAILRMLESWVGEDTFRKGVKKYLEAHANGNAKSEDLWKAVAEVSGSRVEEIMSTFVLQPGVPLVTFEARPVEDGTVLVLAQNRFLTNGAKSGEVWKIPVCFRIGLADGTTKEVCELLGEKSATVRLPGEVSWMVGNVNAKGYYRVGWTAGQLRALVDVVPTLAPAERLSVLADAWAMTENGRLGVDAFLDLASSYRGERNRVVIGTMADAIGKIRRSLLGDDANADYDAWTTGLVAGLAKELGPSPQEGDDDERRELRATIVSILADAGDEDVLASLGDVMRSYLADPSGVDPSLADVAFDAVPARGDEEMFALLEQTMKETDSLQAYNLSMSGLTRFREPALVERAVHLPESGKVRLDRYPSYFEALLRNTAAREATWVYMKEHWEDLKSKVVSFGGRGAMRAIGSFCSAELRDDVKSFFATHDAPGAERALALSLEQVDSCIRFRETQREVFESWLKQRK